MTNSSWQRLLMRLGTASEGLFDRLRRNHQRTPLADERLHIVAHHGFGCLSENGWSGHLSGRVLRDRPGNERDVKPASHSRRLNNLRDNYARFDTRELPNITVAGTMGGVTNKVKTDEEGYFRLAFTLDNGDNGEVDHAGDWAVSLSLPDYHQVRISGDPIVNVPPNDARFGVISDIDDTLLVTQATSFVKMMRLTLFESSQTRIAFPGIATLYEALHDDRNPFFYVSSSPWNLYDFLKEFMRLNNVVAGPLMLRDFGLDDHKFIAVPHKIHKLEQIRTVLDTYPRLSFVLSGDSGQDDPEIYAQIVDEYPGRILAIYIRDINDQSRDESVQQLIDRMKQSRVDMLLMPDSLAAARHAHSIGLLASTSIETVRESIHHDTRDTPNTPNTPNTQDTQDTRDARDARDAHNPKQEQDLQDKQNRHIQKNQKNQKNQKKTQ